MSDLRVEVHFEHNHKNQLHRTHHTNRDESLFLGQLVLEFKPEVLQEEGDLNHTSQHDEKPVGPRDWNEAAKDTDEDHGREAVRVNSYRLENSNVMALSVRLLRAIQVKQELNQQRQTHSDAIDNHSGDWDRFHGKRALAF